MQSTNKVKTIYDPQREWESFDFPIEISSLTFQKNLHDLPGSCLIRISRDENYKLEATIKGYTLNPKALSENKVAEGEGNFAELDTIFGKDCSTEAIITLKGCIIPRFCLEAISYTGMGFPFSAELHFTSFTKEFPQLPVSFNPSVRYDWFICSHVHFFYPYSTIRSNINGPVKARQIFDSPIAEGIFPVNHSRDFFVINKQGYKCIVASVPKDFNIGWADCMCVEYRSDFGIPDDSQRSSITNFLSFLLGTELLKVGSIEFDQNGITKQEAVSPAGDNVRYKCQNGSVPPIQFNTAYEWGDVQNLVDTLFPAYVEKNEALNLDGILWRYFQAKDLTVGINLPVLSSALEILGSNYLKYHTEISLSYLPEKQYRDLIAPELKSLAEKLLPIQGSAKILNKIKGAFHRGANEKMELFFSSIDLPVSKVEQQAMKARNSMAHGGADATTKDETLKQVLYTRAYQTLFHRVILRILGYADYYVDYYISGRNSKKITEPTGRF